MKTKKKETGKKTKKTASKKTPELVEKIYALVREENPSKNRIARRFKLSAQTIANWLHEDEAFRAGYEEAVNYFLDNIKIDAKLSLKKLVNGYEYEEVKTVYIDNGEGDPIIKERVVFQKHVPPSIQAIAFVLKNVEPEKFD